MFLKNAFHKMKSETRHSLSQDIIRNIAFSFLAQLWMIVILFLSMPFIVHKLDVNLYGIYTFIGVIIGYFSFLNLGLGTALTKYISQCLSNKEEDKIRKAFWSCLIAYVFLGILGTVTIFACANILVERLLKIPNDLLVISILVIKLGSIGFLFSMVHGQLTGVIQALARFDILNRMTVIFGTLQVFIIVGLLRLGYSLKEIVMAGLVIQAINIYVYWVYTKKLLPFLIKPSWDSQSLVQLLRFGKFITISAVVSPILLNIEKIFLTSLRSISSLTYYVIPFSLIDRLTFMRSSVSAVLFPAFSYFQDSKSEGPSQDLLYRSTLFLFFIYLFFVCFFISFGSSFLTIWMGPEFAQKSTNILAVLSIAILISAMLAPSYVALQGMDRPHLTAIFHVIETIIYIPLSFMLIFKFGGLGAAIACLIRISLDAILLHKASCDLFGTPITVWYRRLIYKGFPPLVVCALSFWLLKSLNLYFLSLSNMCGILLILILYSYTVWHWGLDNISRDKTVEFLTSFYR